jgi:hypothetical protein
MLTLVEVTNARSDTLELPIFDTSAGYSIRDIQGLSPVKAALTTSSQAQVDGAQPQNARRDVRNITMKIGLEPDYATNTVDSLRSDLYDYFMPKDNISLGFWKDGSLFVVCDGQVESFDNTMFSQDPEVDISILCYDPDFYAPAANVLSANTTSATDQQAIEYAGTSDAGLIFVLAVNRTFTDFALYNTQPDGTVQKYSVTGSFVSGDIVTLNSIPGKKALTLTRGSITSSVLFYGADSSNVWPVLRRGENNIRAFASGSAIPYTVTYTPKFGAI